MFRIAMVVGSVFLALAFVAGVGTSQDKKEKVKGQLPAGWKKLDLSKDQITKIYEVQGKYKAKIKGLQDQIAAMQTEERAAMVNVLTDPQKELLRKLATGEVKKDGDKKPLDKKPVEKDK
jgi:hypothetical protein